MYLIFNLCRQCPYVLEAVIGLAELGVTAKDIISSFTQVSLSMIFLLPLVLIFHHFQSFLRLFFPFCNYLFRVKSLLSCNCCILCSFQTSNRSAKVSLDQIDPTRWLQVSILINIIYNVENENCLKVHSSIFYIPFLGWLFHWFSVEAYLAIKFISSLFLVIFLRVYSVMSRPSGVLLHMLTKVPVFFFSDAHADSA